MSRALLVANALFALGAIAAAVLALLRPQMMSRSESISQGERFYARMYASRAIPAGVLAALAPFCFSGGAVQWVLWAAAAMQVGDALIGWQRREWGMVLAPAVAAAVHAATAVLAVSA